MGWNTDLLTGVASYLAAQGVGIWRADGSAYQAGETAIVLATMPPNPDRVICLQTYPVSVDGSWDVTVGLQVRTRAGRDPREVADLSDAVYDALDGLSGVEFGGVRVSQMFRRSGEELSAPGGTDRQADRHERTDNYYVQARRPSEHRDQ
ncbi:minor capsid protein [Thermomonospora cellulosilytica]|uniref:Tail terminator n=1 Tax=Thermomonospora cellulosilytica TaxID=1411118 RepID=A0A7W3R8H2_9ACTN|nr:minor capsid protein [Thermomonospora cellulosilytica]MBA9003662.1 hypothetical protein [Thermomonospora cellulosilytica]